MLLLKLITYKEVSFELAELYPNWWQNTLASDIEKPLSHTVPHSPLQQTSTRPSDEYSPSCKRTMPGNGLSQSLLESIIKHEYETCIHRHSLINDNNSNLI